MPTHAEENRALVDLFLLTLACGAVGVAIAYCAARIQRKRVASWWGDALLGATGFLAGFFICLISEGYKTENEVRNPYRELLERHPIYTGFALAILFPAMLELHRWK